MKREEVDRRVKEMEEPYSKKFSPEATSICQGLLKKKVGARLGCTSGRNGAKEVMCNTWFNDINWRRLKAGEWQSGTLMSEFVSSDLASERASEGLE